MTAPEPTRPADEHIDAVARAMRQDPKSGGRNMSDVAREVYAERLLTLTDPAVHAAMLDALVRAGALTEEAEDIIGFHDETCPDPCPFGKRRRLVTGWEVAP